jgi:hypothetical protein
MKARLQAKNTAHRRGTTNNGVAASGNEAIPEKPENTPQIEVKELSTKEWVLDVIKHPCKSHETTRLKIGNVFSVDGQDYIVWFVNECRAACFPILENNERIDINKQINISPNSEVKIARRLKSDEMIEIISKQQSGRAGGTRAGRLGSYEGHSIVSVIRAMGAQKWTFKEARDFFNSKQISVADNTIRIQLKSNGIAAPVKLERPKMTKRELARPAAKK